MLLELYDTYYLPMQGGLRPVMKSFILALLPGLEEETGEFFDKVRPLQTIPQHEINEMSGSWPSGSFVWHSVAFVLPAKRVVDHVDHTCRSRNINQLPFTAITSPKRGRR